MQFGIRLKLNYILKSDVACLKTNFRVGQFSHPWHWNKLAYTNDTDIIEKYFTHLHDAIYSANIEYHMYLSFST